MAPFLSSAQFVLSDDDIPSPRLFPRGPLEAHGCGFISRPFRAGEEGGPAFQTDGAGGPVDAQAVSAPLEPDPAGLDVANLRLAPLCVTRPAEPLTAAVPGARCLQTGTHRGVPVAEAE